MRAHLYYDDWKEARQAAYDIQKLNLYELDKDFIKMFSLEGQDSKEIIYADQHIEDLYKFSDVVRLYNNQDGGWASFVPTQNLVDMFEMENGLMPSEANSGYNERHPLLIVTLACIILLFILAWIGKVKMGNVSLTH